MHGVLEAAIGAFAVTPSDTVDLAVIARALYIGTTGDLEVVMASGETVTFSSVPVGILPVQVKRVKVGATTASNILALYN